MKTIDVSEFATQWETMVLTIEKTREGVVICRDGIPIADLLPHHRPSRLTPHPVISDVVMHYDPTEPLAPDEWDEEES